MKKWILTALGTLLSLGLGYLFLTGHRYSRLIGFFGYMSVACTLIPLPTPPYVIALGQDFHPGIVALAGAVGNCIAAFVCLVFTGFTPIPFEPFRFAAILARYNLLLYLLAVLVGRFPRYYLIALIGDQFRIPTRSLVILLIVSLAIPIIGLLIKRQTSEENIERR